MLEIVLLNRLREEREIRTREIQADFRPGRGCADQIFTLRQIVWKRNEYQQPTLVVFLDFCATFDSVHRDSLWNIMLLDGVPEKISIINKVSIINAIYKNTPIRVRVYEELSESFEISTGFRQCGILSQTLFNFAIDWILKNALDGQPGGVNLSDGGVLTDLTYADDIALLAESEEDLGGMIDRIYQYSSKIGLNISAAKSKVLLSHHPDCHVSVNGEDLDIVTSFRYFGSESPLQVNPMLKFRPEFEKLLQHLRLSKTVCGSAKTYPHKQNYMSTRQQSRQFLCMVVIPGH